MKSNMMLNLNFPSFCLGLLRWFEYVEIMQEERPTTQMYNTKGEK